jgi:hypothetical protein
LQTELGLSRREAAALAQEWKRRGP